MGYYSDKYTIMVHDIDIHNNAYPSIIARYMQETANHQMRDRRPTYMELFENGQSFIATRVAFQMFDQLHQYEEVEVRTWTCPGKAATFIRNYQILREGTEVARGYSEWAVVEIATGRLCRTDEIDLSAYDRDDLLPLDFPIRFRFPKDANFERVGTRHVEYEMVDMNMHMNNTHYQNMCWNHVPEVEKKKITSFNLRFMAEAPYDSDIEIYRYQLEEPIDDGSGAEETYYFRTVVGGRTNIEAIVCVARI